MAGAVATTALTPSALSRAACREARKAACVPGVGRVTGSMGKRGPKASATSPDTVPLPPAATATLYTSTGPPSVVVEKAAEGARPAVKVAPRARGGALPLSAGYTTTQSQPRPVGRGSVDTVRPLAKACAAVVFRLPMAKRAAGRAALPPARVAGTVAVRAGERVTLESVRVPTGTAPLPAALRVTAAPLLQTSRGAGVRAVPCVKATRMRRPVGGWSAVVALPPPATCSSCEASCRLTGAATVDRAPRAAAMAARGAAALSGGVLTPPKEQVKRPAEVVAGSSRSCVSGGTRACVRCTRSARPGGVTGSTPQLAASRGGWGL